MHELPLVVKGVVVLMEAHCTCLHAPIATTSPYLLFLLCIAHVFGSYYDHNAFHFANAAAATSPQPLPLAALCNTTTYASLCFATLSTYPSSKPSALLQDLTAYVVSQALLEVNRTYRIGKKLAAHEEAAADNFTLQDCLDQMDNAVEGLNRSVRRLAHLDASTPADGLRGEIMDVRVWLSASLTYMDTCWDELSDPKEAPLKARMSTINQKIEPLLAIALSMAQTLQEGGGASTSYALPRHHPVHP